MCNYNVYSPLQLNDMQDQVLLCQALYITHLYQLSYFLGLFS